MDDLHPRAPASGHDFRDAEGKLGLLREAVFGAVDAWNAAHPQRLKSHREHAAINVVRTYVDAGGEAGHSIVVECGLATGSSCSTSMTFRGRNLADLAEHARDVVANKIEAEVRRREDDERERAAHRERIS